MKRFLMLSLHYVAPLLAELFNECLSAVIFPTSLKTSRITPTYKKGPKNDISNYKLVSILVNIAKIFESLIFDRLSKFFINKNILFENQYGFRKGKNTELAALCLINGLLPSISLKKYAICVFLDYSACFDTLCRELLLRKLDRYGVRGVPLKFLASYRVRQKNRTFF